MLSVCPDCPDGNTPGIAGVSGDNWAPIADSKNDYVQIGLSGSTNIHNPFTCELKSYVLDSYHLMDQVVTITGKAEIATSIRSWAQFRAGAPKVRAIPSGDMSVVQVAYLQRCFDYQLINRP